MRLTRSKLIAALAIPIVLIALLLLPMGGGHRTVTAHFTNAISIYPGTDVTIMGVAVGKVTSVKPEGSTVKVTMEYDDQYKLPSDVKAALVTPTLVADRFVQLVPAYDGGPTLKDDGDIPLARSVTPVEMDQIYSSLGELTDALGPNGANKDGALGAVLADSAKALKGNGQAGHDMIENLSKAAQTLGDNSDNLFQTVDGLAALSEKLKQNDTTVSQFLTKLSGVSTQLATESPDLAKALDAIADAVSVTRSFVKDNKGALITDVKKLSDTIEILAKQKDSLGTTVQLAPLGLANLGDGFDTGTGTEGARFQFGPLASDLPGVLCNVVTADKIPNASALCSLIKALVPATVTNDIGAGVIDGFGLHGISGVTPGSGSGGIGALTDQLSQLSSKAAKK
ncbi:MCE family protein [Nocardioides sp. Kera G14]|uniref:MCE family protein n=1 Tax=Nocardioides sp. Kera G14 TaxID=2884264 RepID=UPI001D10F61A|nr:MCE family protein [Nocardioides sp. Kera G14]UDY22304.1 MCE family protein [Nocardioides sp. Kera G14]